MNAADAFDIGSFDEEDTKGIKVLGFAWPLTPEPSPGGIHVASLPLLDPAPAGCQLLGLRLLTLQTSLGVAVGPGCSAWGPVANGCPCPVCMMKLLDSDQELYRNFPLTISERWQQEVAETVFDTINAETDRLETRKKTKNKQLGHEEGEGSQLPALEMSNRVGFQKPTQSHGQRAAAPGFKVGQVQAPLSPPVSLSRQTMPWARTASCMATWPRWATPS